MAGKVTINGKSTAIPGIYASIKSGIKTEQQDDLTYGAVMLIDTGAGAGYVGGTAVAGTRKPGLDSMLTFTTIQEMRAICRGSYYWKLAQLLFQPDPNNPQIQGVSRVHFMKACAAAPSGVSFVLNTNSVTIATLLDEGTAANGVLTSGELTAGYAIKMKPSLTTSGSYFLEFYVGTYKGVDQTLNTVDFDFEGNRPIDTKPTLLFATKDFSTFDECVSVLANNPSFTAMFVLTPTLAAGGSTAIPLSDYTTFGTAYKLFAAGSNTYNSTHYDTVLDLIEEVPYAFLLAPDSGDNAASAYNTKLITHVTSEALYDKQVYIGGGSTSAKFKAPTAGASATTSIALNSQKAVVVHGGYYETFTTLTGYRVDVERGAFFKAAAVLGRTCGLEPQNPLTFKKMFSWNREVHRLTRDEKEYALEKGLLCTFPDPSLGVVILQGVNSLQNNQQNFNTTDSTSYLITVNRIAAELNYQIMTQAKIDFFGNETGVNRGTLSTEDIKSWTSNLLKSRMASATQDNLIIGIGEITVVFENDCFKVDYGFIPNYEINKMVFTGLVISQ